jgi:hypothetical protein
MKGGDVFCSFAAANTACLSYVQLSAKAPAHWHCQAAAVAQRYALNSNIAFTNVCMVLVTLQISRDERQPLS